MAKKITVKYWQAKGRSRLNRLLKELGLMSAGIIVLSPGGRDNEVVLPRGLVPFPQSPPEALFVRLSTRKPDEWRDILGDEILAYLKHAHKAGQRQALSDAWNLCREWRLPLPEWIRDTRKRNRRGTRSSQYDSMLFWKDLLRYAAFKASADEVAAARKRGARSNAARAKEMLKYSWADTPDEFSTKGFEKAIERFTTRHDSYYFPPTLLISEIIRYSAPTAYRVLTEN